MPALKKWPHNPYKGQCCERFHILHQWDGLQWVEVPDYRPSEGTGRPDRIIFDVEDALHTDPDPADAAFRPRGA